MPAIVTDQFRILNANNFVESVENTSNSYYVFVGLSNPGGPPDNALVGFGRSESWDTNTPAPIDSFSYRSHTQDTMMYGKRVSSANIRRLIRRVDWVSGNQYEIYRDDYSVENPSPLTSANRLYDANYYVMNSDFKVYVCIDNGSTGSNPKGNASEHEPTFTDLEPSKAGDDGFIWKYLFTVSPSDIIKFDSTEFITVPNDWLTSTDAQIRSVRENGDSSVNSNQIKHVYIEKAGEGYNEGIGQECDIVGDGTGAKARVDVQGGKITDVRVSAGGKGYSYGLVDLGNIDNINQTESQKAKLIPIIPPGLGHGSDIYTELGTDKVIVYARFDDTTKDFPTDTKFAQVGIVKNPTKEGTSEVYTESTFSSLQAVKFETVSATPIVGEEITQLLNINSNPNKGRISTAYVASFDKDTKVLKYFRDRTLNFNRKTYDQTDNTGISTAGRIYQFETASLASGDTPNPIEGKKSQFSGSISRGFSGITTNVDGSRVINLGTRFTDGLSNTEINKGSGEVIYLDNRPEIVRNTRQKEDIKIILEF